MSSSSILSQAHRQNLTSQIGQIGIHNEQIGMVTPGNNQALPARSRFQSLIALFLESRANKAAAGSLHVDDENSFTDHSGSFQWLPIHDSIGGIK